MTGKKIVILSLGFIFDVENSTLKYLIFFYSFNRTFRWQMPQFMKYLLNFSHNSIHLHENSKLNVFCETKPTATTTTNKKTKK